MSAAYALAEHLAASGSVLATCPSEAILYGSNQGRTLTRSIRCFSYSDDALTADDEDGELLEHRIHILCIAESLTAANDMADAIDGALRSEFTFESRTFSAHRILREELPGSKRQGVALRYVVHQQ